jgi:hypothetical protein
MPQDSSTARGFGLPWFALTVAFACHVLDEASTGFLGVYNPTVTAVRARWGWFPMPTFEFREWLVGLILGVLICFALTPVAARGRRWCGRSHGSMRSSCFSTAWDTRCSRHLGVQSRR